MTCLEGNTHRLADVGNRVHTRHDSDEDVRGNAYKQTIAWRALPWSFIIQANKCNLCYLPELNVEVKPSRLFSACSFLPRATLRLPPVTNIGKPMCIAFQARLHSSFTYLEFAHYRVFILVYVNLSSD